MKAEEVKIWFEEEILPVLVKSETLSEGEVVQSIQECHFEAVETGICSFASALTFAKLLLNTTNGSLCKELFIKFQFQCPILREKMKLTVQFRNEVKMYKEILPSFADFLEHCNSSPELVSDLAPKCHFACHVDASPEKSVIVLEDLRTRGYGLASSVTDLDLDHCLAALERLAHFHAISFAMKFRRWEFFDRLRNSSAKVWSADDEWTRKQCEDYRGCSAQRGIEFLISQKHSEVPLNYLENLKKMLDPAGLFDLLTTVSSPTEPLSVICHGDFNRNNILYRYDGGKVVDAKLVDFQMFVYGSPCLDLSFFIYMNTTLEFREKHFDDILKHYHSSLVKRIALVLDEPEDSFRDRLPLEAFREDFARVAINAYVTVSFFLPAMMAPLTSEPHLGTIDQNFKQMALDNYIQGGETVSRRIAEVIVDFYRRRFYV